jgi:hypothetical protein
MMPLSGVRSSCDTLDMNASFWSIARLSSVMSVCLCASCIWRITTSRRESRPLKLDSIRPALNITCSARWGRGAHRETTET